MEGRGRWKRGRRRGRLEAQWRWLGRRWASRAVDCRGRSTAREGGWGWRLIARRSVAQLGRECGGVGQVRSTGRGSRASAAVAGVRAKRALQRADHLYRPGPVLLCSRFFACFYFASLRVCSTGTIACVSGLRGACFATFRVCERVGLLGAVGVWARVLPFGRTGALPSGGQYSRVESCSSCSPVGL